MLHTGRQWTLMIVMDFKQVSRWCPFEGAHCCDGSHVLGECIPQPRTGTPYIDQVRNDNVVF